MAIMAMKCLITAQEPCRCNSCNLSPLEAKSVGVGQFFEILKREMESYIGGKLPEKSGPPFVLFQGTERKAIMAKTLLQEIKGMKERAKAPTKAGSVLHFLEINLGQ